MPADVLAEAQRGGLADVASLSACDDGRQSGHSTTWNGRPVTVSVSHTNHPSLCACRRLAGAARSQVRQFTLPTIRDR